MTTETQDTGTATTDAGGTQTTDTTDSTVASTAPEQSTEPKAEAAPAEPAEIEYKFEPPEGVELNQDDLKEFTAIAKELKLPQDAASKLVDLAAKREIARAEAFAKQVSDWENAVKGDKELGNPENLAVARKAIDTFGGPALRDLLETTGLGNHPEVVRMALAVGRAMSEDKILAGRTETEARRDPAQVLYGNTPN